jgi:hypothetical protein
VHAGLVAATMQKKNKEEASKQQLAHRADK